MKKLFTGIILLIPFISSCSDDMTSESKRLSDNKMTPKTLSIQKAVEHAEIVLSLLDSGKTRSRERIIGTIETFQSDFHPLTRSDDDASFYLLNYENEGGFVLLNAKNPHDPVLAFAESGTLNLSDTVFNKGLASYVNDISQHAMNAPSAGADPTMPSGPDSIISYENRILVGPLLSERMQSLDQRCAPTLTQSGCVANCVAVSMAQIMSFYKWPESYNGTKIDWDGINKGSRDDQITWVIDQLSNSKNLNVIFGANSSGTITPDAPGEFLTQTAKNWSYTAPGNPIAASSIYTAMTVNRQHRVVMTKVVTGPRSFHAFTVDGYMEIESGSYPSNDPSQNIPMINNYVHVIWGFGKNANGYFRWNSYDTKIMGNAFEWDTATPEVFSKYGGFVYYNGLIPQK